MIKYSLRARSFRCHTQRGEPGFLLETVVAKLIDLTDQMFGRLTVLERAENNKHGMARWHCVCLCGKTITIRSSSLVSGHTKSCGCLKIEGIRKLKTTHGMVHHPAYISWLNMKTRCGYKNHHGWVNYGGRGISVCERWFDSFENFWADMGNTYKEGLSIDRIDNEKGYSPGNCRWATKVQQTNNTRMSRRNKSGYRGVSWDKNCNKWRTSVRENKKSKHLGLFSDKTEAALARDNYIEENNLPAQLNF